MIKEFTQAKNRSVSLEFDHWQDCSSRDLLAIVLTFQSKKRFLLSLIAATGWDKTADDIVNILVQKIEKLPEKDLKLNAVISDSAAGSAR